MRSRDIIRSAFGKSRNFMSPNRVKIISIVRGKVAAELSWGEGMMGVPYVYGVSVARVIEGTIYDKAERFLDGTSKSFCGDNLSTLHGQAMDYIDELKEKLS